MKCPYNKHCHYCSTPQEDKKGDILFDDIESQIKEILQQEVDNLFEPVTLLTGIFPMQFLDRIPGSPLLGGPSIPSVALLGKSGRLYIYAVKKLLPDLRM